MEFAGQIEIDVLVACICYALLFTTFSDDLRSTSRVMFRAIIITVIASVCLDFCVYFFWSAKGPVLRTILLFLYYVVAATVSVTWLAYVRVVIGGPSQHAPLRIQLLTLIPLLMLGVYLAIEAFSGRLTDHLIGTGTMTPGGLAFCLILVLYIASAGYLALRARSHETSEDRRRLLLWLSLTPLPMALGLASELTWIPLNLTWICAAMMLVVAYVNVQLVLLTNARRAAEDKLLEEAAAKTQLRNARVSLASSQMKPHFVYNALNAIDYLCLADPASAKLAIGNFRRYLSENLEAMSDPTPIPILREIDHVKDYLSIEALRFPKIEVRFEIGPDTFALPPLTIQPLVENAVRHGMRPHGNEGTIVVSTWEDEAHWCVSVDDDGPGFGGAPQSSLDVAEGQRGHTGVANVRERTETAMGGQLVIEKSQLGGARVTVMVPKEAK